MGYGTLYGVGVGPGDPELLTLKAHRLLRSAPVICIPKRNLSDDGYALRIVRPFIDPGRQELLELEFPMTRDPEKLAACWDRNATLIHGRVAAGKDCVFITEGDPLLYSTFLHVLDLIRERYPAVPIEVVPGVSSSLGAAARVQMPLGAGGERMALVTDLEGEEDARDLLQRFDSVVFFKVNSTLRHVLAALDRTGLTDRAVWVHKATAPGLEEVVTDVRTLPRRGRLPYLSLLLVRK
ncbi:precorrin-2 C(20)-methyltransferase [Caldinitratiruptor microaerophilus]|uniref:Precorrin-2 C(20)-methyltransferase n=1 Tax=Caldinitratiruptor microaerophilus TaxID=671077 RepID=A0AA35CNB8_9FIRM|nr:precorrin-2 C(20)-methyltransferase [Caldinitratiruptor microaerophilus]BDG61558.1 precorrin-2 C(20)-methyltransferase [Caldinitratiruptor microaerophilus]